MLPYEIERVVCVCKSRVARDEEDDGMDSYLQARGRNTTSSHFLFGKQSLGPRKRLKEEED